MFTLSRQAQDETGHLAVEHRATGRTCGSRKTNGALEINGSRNAATATGDAA
jgi:hypothetical protein